MKKGIIFLVCFCCLTGLCHGQNKKIDSLLQVLKTAKEDTGKVNTLNALAYESRDNNSDTAVSYANEALALATKLNYKIGIAEAHFYKGNGLRFLGKYKEQLENYNYALKLYDELLSLATIGDKLIILKGKGNAYNGIGLVNYDIGNYPEGLKNYFTALRIFEEIGFKKGIAMAYSNIGSTYDDQGNYAESLKNYLAALKINEEFGIKRYIAGNLNDIGTIYDDLGNYSEALKNYLAALKLNEELGNKYWKAINLNNIGNVYIDQGNYTEALRQHFAGLKISQEIGNKDLMACCCNNIGTDYTKLKKYSEASRYLNKGLSVAKEIGELPTIQYSYIYLANLDSAQGNFKQSLEHYKLYITYKDRLVNAEASKKTMQIQMQYDFDKKESLAKAEQEKKDAIALKELQKQKLLKNFFIGGIGLVLVLFFFIYRTYRARQVLRLYDIRNRIAGDLHDDIGSTLNSISIYSEVAKKNDEHHDEALEMIGDASRKVIDAMSDIVWTINAENDSFEKIIFRMKSLAYNLFRAKKIEFTFHADEILNEKKLSLEERRNFYLIFKEAVNNLVKYSNATRAAITLTNENDRIRLRIQDDGIGFDTSQEIAGNGLKNMKRRAGEMKAGFQVESQIGGGTRIELILKA